MRTRGKVIFYCSGCGAFFVFFCFFFLSQRLKLVYYSTLQRLHFDWNVSYIFIINIFFPNRRLSVNLLSSAAMATLLEVELNEITGQDKSAAREEHMHCQIGL